MNEEERSKVGGSVELCCTSEAVVTAVAIVPKPEAQRTIKVILKFTIHFSGGEKLHTPVI